MLLTIGTIGLIPVTFHTQHGVAVQHVPIITMDFRQILFRNTEKTYGGTRVTTTVVSGWSRQASTWAHGQARFTICMSTRSPSSPSIPYRECMTVGTQMPCGTFSRGRNYLIGSKLKKDIDNLIVAEGWISKEGKLPELLPKVLDLAQEVRAIPTYRHQEKRREDRGREHTAEGETMPIAAVPPHPLHDP